MNISANTTTGGKSGLNEGTNATYVRNGLLEAKGVRG